MARWECHDLTTLALDHVAFIDAIVQLVEKRETGDGAASTTVIKWTLGGVQPLDLNPASLSLLSRRLRIRSFIQQSSGFEISASGFRVAANFLVITLGNCGGFSHFFREPIMFRWHLVDAIGTRWPGNL
jgi:hypothetical protein